MTNVCSPIIIAHKRFWKQAKISTPHKAFEKTLQKILSSSRTLEKTLGKN